MKIKQATKFAILAIALVAVLGVGAVSFAAWQNGGFDALNTASADVGNVELFGFTSDSATWKDGNSTLVPVDQADNNLGNGAKMISLQTPEYEATKNFKITLTATWTGNDGHAMPAFYYCVGDLASAPDKSALTAEGTQWKVLTAGTALELLAGEIDASGYVNGTLANINIVMVSDSNADMNAGSLSLAVAIVENA